MVDMAYLCHEEAAKLRRDLERVVLVAGEAMTTIARQARVGVGGRRTDPDPPSPVNLPAAYDHDAAINTLVTWARHVHESSGRVLPRARTETCRHPSCARIVRGVADGPLCPIAIPEHPTAVLAEWMTHQLDWLRHRQEASEAYDEIADACRVLERIVDRPPDRVLVGQCGCTAYLYAVRGAEQVTCTECGTAYAVEDTRDAMRAELDQSLFTAAEIATLATYLGLERPRETTRKLINKWSERGLVVAHSHLRGEPAYRFGDVMARLLAG